MKIIKSLLAVSVLAAGPAYAACYNVTGSMTGISTVGASSTPSLYVHAGSTSYSTSPSIFPSFSSSTLCINTSTSPATITGIFSNFVQYSTSVRVLGGLVTAVVNQPHLVYSFNGGTTAWAPTSPGSVDGTLTLGQVLTMTGGNSQTSDASLLFDTANGATAGSCTGSSLICNGQATWFLAFPNLELFYLTLTVAPTASTISGTAVGADTGGAVTGGNTGNTWYSYSFTGTKI
jgi:hypothetical protein